MISGEKATPVMHIILDDPKAHSDGCQYIYSEKIPTGIKHRTCRLILIADYSASNFNLEDIVAAISILKKNTAALLQGGILLSIPPFEGG